MAKQIRMVIPLAGISTGERKIQVEAEGYKGEGCKAATEVFTKALGVVGDETIKPEMYEQEQRYEHLSEGG